MVSRLLYDCAIASRRPSSAFESLIPALDRWRHQTAKANNVSPGAVLTDRAIQSIAYSTPSTLDDLAGCPGVTPGTLDRYGDDLVALIAKHTTRPPD